MDKDKHQRIPQHSRSVGTAGHSRTFHSGSNNDRNPLRKTVSHGVSHFDSKTPRGFGGKKLDRPHHRAGLRHQPSGHRTFGSKLPETVIPNLAPDSIRVIPLGGVEQIGQNMTAVEFGNDILVLDAGFQFKEEDTPGIDYILPNTKYLEERKKKIKAVIITHGHLDHIGGIPYLMERLGNPPLYSRALTTLMVKKRQEEFPHLQALDIRVIEKEDTIKIGALSVKFFSVTHTIPDSMGVIIETPYGAIVNPGDIKLDHIDGAPTEAEEKEYERFKNENVLFLMMDSTNVDNPGFSTPERLVHKNLDEIIKNTKNRLIIATFSSQLERMMNIIQSAEKYGKKVVVDGRSMKNNIEIVKNMGMLKVKKDTLILPEEMESYPPDKIVALVTGAQGDEFAALMRMSNKSHKYFKITPRDSVLLSSSIIPGNERAVQKLKDNLARQGAKIIHYRSSDVYIHSTGHGNRGELEWLHRHIKPKFFMPIHGTHYMLRVHEELAKSLGQPAENIVVPDNGTVVEIQNGGEKLVRLKEKAPAGMVMVDGFSVGDVQEVVIRDRQMLAQDGMFVIIASVNSNNGKLKKSPDIISRGFVYLRESQDLLHQTRIIIKKTIEDTTVGMNPINFEYVKSVLTDNVGRFLFQKTAKRPIVIPVLLSV
ncbi:MAG: RNA-metabolising metallo-beta-lactamase [candidate division CPR1 bacterium GW2011_GWA2_42_17]|uniref:Ribonuclease J n=1 Tax=candidate division CPR1 bacterium GW2011_GWA2_42_17 TaxID=1618341 RepID=A0A0G0Z6J6_9BACT|nr:MAG: RNA-metabolising metallo-beta-lactamase [candidate division CPR1 bacterium GW2011_GWA2_42_17]